VKRSNGVLIIGGNGEFGQFLRHDILPALEVTKIAIIERDTPRELHPPLLESARHIILATPLAGYAERACELIYQCRDFTEATTLWFIPSVQAGAWRAVSATLEILANPYLSAVFIHPMYGPNGFRETEPEARTFQNVQTARHEGSQHSLEQELSQVAGCFLTHFNISTTNSFDPDQHDRVTAYSQGLSYCVGRLMFECPDIDAVVRNEMPELHHSFTANHDLILDFVRVNSYMPQVLAAFAHAWSQTKRATYSDVLNAFSEADASLNRGEESPISTKWYEKLRKAVGASLRGRPSLDQETP
jgi:prephenate dehydrogenase